MATKKKAGYKKGSTRKKAIADNDPPIIVSGGGGPGSDTGILGPFINVNFDLEGGPGSGTWKATVDGEAITGARISFKVGGVDTGDVVTLKGGKVGQGPFEITIQFTSG